MIVPNAMWTAVSKGELVKIHCELCRSLLAIYYPKSGLVMPMEGVHGRCKNLVKHIDDSLAVFCECGNRVDWPPIPIEEQQHSFIVAGW